MKLRGQIKFQESDELKTLELLINSCRGIVCTLYDSEMVELAKTNNITIHSTLEEIDLILSNNLYENIIYLKWDSINQIVFTQLGNEGFIRINLKEESEIEF